MNGQFGNPGGFRSVRRKAKPRADKLPLIIGPSLLGRSRLMFWNDCAARAVHDGMHFEVYHELT